MTRSIEGCVHLIIEKGKIVNVFTHLNHLPKTGVVHLKADKIYNFEEFKESHPLDKQELSIQNGNIIVSTFILPSKIERLRKQKKTLDKKIIGCLKEMNADSINKLPGSLKKIVKQKQIISNKLELVKRDL